MIGTGSQAYYLEQFRRFELQGGGGASWHWPAFFVTFWWLLYRKMWLVAGVYFVLAYLLATMLGAIGMAVAGLAGMTFAYLVHLAVVCIVPALFANALYYGHCRRKIAATAALSDDPPRRIEALARKGGTSIVAVAVVAVLLFVGGMMAAIALPAYQDYVTRAQVAEAAALGTTATTAVEEFYYRNQRTPVSLEEAGLSLSLPSSVRHIGVDGSNGMVAVVLDIEPLEGGSLVLVPALGADGRISWSCVGQDIEDRYLPSRCRRQP